MLLASYAAVFFAFPLSFSLSRNYAAKVRYLKVPQNRLDVCMHCCIYSVISRVGVRHLNIEITPSEEREGRKRTKNGKRDDMERRTKKLHIYIYLTHSRAPFSRTCACMHDVASVYCCTSKSHTSHMCVCV